ncbi:hypothetical protein KM043_004069 [Ampulex compressa]|nr:hypothetical protein KM043_004069 [Ampulex compressa]
MASDATTLAVTSAEEFHRTPRMRGIGGFYEQNERPNRATAARISTEAGLPCRTHFYPTTPGKPVSATNLARKALDDPRLGRLKPIVDRFRRSIDSLDPELEVAEEVSDAPSRMLRGLLRKKKIREL